jgi:hypothetical protein
MSAALAPPSDGTEMDWGLFLAPPTRDPVRETSIILKDGSPCDSYLTEETHRLTVSPAFLAQLRSLAPKRRRPKGLYVVVFLTLLALAVVLVSDRSTRQFLRRSHRPTVDVSAAALVPVGPTRSLLAQGAIGPAPAAASPSATGAAASSPPSKPKRRAPAVKSRPLRR